MLLHHVYNEDGCGNAVHVRNGTQVLLELGTLTAHLQALTLRHGVQCSVGFHLVNLGHLANRLTDGCKVGQHATRPTLGHKRHVHGLSRFGYDVLGLLLRGHKQNALSAFGHLLGRCCCVVHQHHSLVEVDDVNALLLREDVWGHMGVPLALKVAEVGSCLKQLVEIGACHVATFLGLSNNEVASFEGPRCLDASCIC